MSDTVTVAYDTYYEAALLLVLGQVGSDTLSLHLSTDSAPITSGDVYGSYTEPSSSIGYTPILFPEFGVVQGLGDSTATCTTAAWVLQQPTFGHETATIYGWWLQDDTSEILLCGGSISPPLTVPPGPAVSIRLAPITLTLGTCPPTPSATTLLSDTFGGTVNTSLAAHAISPVNVDSVSYTNTLGAGLVLNGAAACFGAAGTTDVASTTGPLETSDVTVRALVTLNATSNQEGGIMLGCDSAGNGWVCDLRGVIFGTIELFDLTSGTFSYILSLNMPQSAGVPYPLLLSRSGDTIT
ncbi:MAG: hypothetical protein WCC95_14565, partial [Candidatus Sulfotelmatobacter sp.]